MARPPRQLRWLAEFKAKHGIPYSTAYRRANPEQDEKHRAREIERWHSNPACRQRHRHVNRRYRQKTKLAAFEAYGGAQCRCCGETIIEFLTIDHVRNDGAAHRKETGGGGLATYRWLKKMGYPKGFQVLCMNCNWAKGHFGRCPHKRKRSDWED